VNAKILILCTPLVQDVGQKNSQFALNYRKQIAVISLASTWNEQVVRVWRAEIGLSAVASEGEEMDCPDCWKRRRPLGIQKTLRPYSFRVQRAQVRLAPLERERTWGTRAVNY
jgi:hypothetical protein